MLLRLASAAAVALGVVTWSTLSGAPTASAATCAERVITDWRDGHIERKYSAGCLRSALKALPEDLRIYGTAEEDILRALNGALVRANTRSAAQTAARTLASSGRTTTARPQAKREPATAKRSRSLSGRPKPERTRGVAAAVTTRVRANGGGGFPVATVAVVAAVALGAAALALSLRPARRLRRHPS